MECALMSTIHLLIDVSIICFAGYVVELPRLSLEW